MKSTDFGVARASLDRAVPLAPRAPVQVAETTTNFGGSAGLWSTVTDYSHFVQMLLDDGSANGHRILKPETVKLMTSNQIGPLPMYGYPPMGMPSEGLVFGLGVLNVAIPVAAGSASGKLRLGRGGLAALVGDSSKARCHRDDGSVIWAWGSTHAARRRKRGNECDRRQKLERHVGQLLARVHLFDSSAGGGSEVDAIELLPLLYTLRCKVAFVSGAEFGRLIMSSYRFGMRYYLVLLLSSASSLAASPAGAQMTAAAAQSTSTAQAAASTPSAMAVSPAASPLPDYHPSFGDLMTMAVQPRHIKLWLAGKDKNWSYAAYELSELRNAFARIARTVPKYQTADTAEIFTALTTAPMNALQQAIMEADEKQFVGAYSQLTNACNACHVSQKHAMVVIKVPESAMYSDQDFREAPHSMRAR